MSFKTRQKGPRKAGEIVQAETFFRFVQIESLTNVSKSPKSRRETLKTMNFTELSTFIEEHGTIRGKGRLNISDLDDNAKHPTLLTAKRPFVQLQLKRAHYDNLPKGTEYMRNMLQQEYWIIGLRNASGKIQLI